MQQEQSNVSEATIAKGTLLAAEEQQKYDVSFYRDVLTFNGNEGGADPDAWDFGSVSTKGYPTLKWLLTYDNLPITIEEPEHLEPSEKFRRKRSWEKSIQWSCRKLYFRKSSRYCQKRKRCRRSFLEKKRYFQSRKKYNQ